MLGVLANLLGLEWGFGRHGLRDRGCRVNGLGFRVQGLGVLKFRSFGIVPGSGMWSLGLLGGG